MKMSRTLAVAFVCGGVATCASAQVLFDNGPLVTTPTGACLPAGSSASEVQNPNINAGYNNNQGLGFRCADDFTVIDPAGWQVTGFRFYGYQTGSPTAPVPITQVTCQIWNGPPGAAGSSVVAGDTTTNVLTASAFSNIYRYFNATCATDRAIFNLDVSLATVLPAGTYWVDWSYTGSASFSGPWAPTTTYTGFPGPQPPHAPGNAMQNNAGVWGPVVDSVPQDFAFVVNGTVVGGVVGACCRTDGSCIIATPAGCTAVGGIYRGDGTVCATANCPQPPTGACCFETSCQVLTQAQCTAQQGTYRGNNVTCAAANCPISPICNGGFESGQFPPCWTQFGDTSFSAVHTGTFILPPHGGTHAAHFGPTSSNGGIMQTINCPAGTPVTITFWYTSSGTPSFFSADLGTTNLVSFTNDLNHPDWTQFTFTVPAPSANPVLTFTFFNPPSYGQLDDVSVTLGSTTGCYANCDGSTTPPILNVNDFICFQAAFAAGASYANCDGSTTVPVLNVNDFICFQTKFAAGCTAP